jgi:hypothetical protein
MTLYYDGEEVVEFVSKCPIQDCTNNEIIHWRHTGCILGEYINSNGEIICNDCKMKKGFYEWNFNCGSHENYCGSHKNYKPPSRDPQRLMAAFALVSRLRSGGGKKFVRKLLENLIDQCDIDD